MPPGCTPNSSVFRSPLSCQVRRLGLLALCSVAVGSLKAETDSLNLSVPVKPVRRGHLDLGGTRPPNDSIAVNSYYLEQNGRPFIPIVGEFHYCRMPAEFWEDSLRKMKAGGINIVASYVFWNLHERREGAFDWTGDLDLRRFVSLAKKVGLQVIVRIGPFGHGEIRNGGLPDWIYGKPLEIRCNDPGYLAYVEKLYGEIGRQLDGLLYRYGGPVIGVQLENEFQHSAAPWEIRYAGAPKEFTAAERDLRVTHGGVSVSAVENQNTGYGRDHMVNLKQIARRQGLDVPLYTATGWGNAAIVPRGSIPVTAGYAYPFWADVGPSPFYLFKDIHREPDYLPVSYEPDLYPSIAAELGAGISSIYGRRPFVPEESVEPLIVRVLGSGSNGVGYYMYHGGTTPVFDQFYNEDASGLPKLNYDYQAPIGQYGQPKAHFQSLRLIHLFLESFGELLAPTSSILPTSNKAITPADVSTLRYAARAADGAGFIFLLNFQDHVATRDLTRLQLQINDGQRTIPVPSQGEFTLKSGAAAILPINLKLGSGRLRSATVQPLTKRVIGGITHFVFFSIDGMNPELVFEGGTVSHAEKCQVEKSSESLVVKGNVGECFTFTIDETPVLVIPRKLALQTLSLADGRILFSPAMAFAENDRTTLLVRGANTVDLSVYPAGATPPQSSEATVSTMASPLSTMSSYRLSFVPVALHAAVKQINAKKFVVHVDDVPWTKVNDALLRVNYTGDTGMAFIDGKMVNDHFYSGRVWELGLRRFQRRLADQDLVFVFQPLSATATYLGDLPPAFRPKFPDGSKELLEFSGVELIPEYRLSLSFR